MIVWRLFVHDFQYSRRSYWLWNEPKGAFHLSELTGQTIPVVMRILLLIKTFQLDPSNPKYYARRRWEKPISFVKMLLRPWSGRPVLTFGKRPKFLEIRVGIYCLCYSSLFVRSTVVPFWKHSLLNLQPASMRRYATCASPIRHFVCSLNFSLA